MISITHVKSDDERFIALVSRILSTAIQDLRPKYVFLTRIDHWFDHKWLGFSGKLLGAVGVHKKRLTIPPFTPRRVVSHHFYYLRARTGAYTFASMPSLHCRQPSSFNLTRYIDRLSQSGLFVWFSGGTSDADHGSVMVYNSQHESQSGWYASFSHTDDWRIHKVRGISRSELESLIERGVNAHAA